MSFQKTVLIIALIVLSVMLFFIALAMKGLKKSQEYPPEVSECPDYWTKKTVGDKMVCSPSLGKNTSGGNGCEHYDGTKEKDLFAQDCGIQWDGLTNI